MKGKHIPFLAFPVFFLAFLLLSPLSVDAARKDKPRGKEKEEIVVDNGEWVDTSLCIAAECGTTLGTKTQALYEKVCEWDCPTIHYEWTVKTYLDCPEGYNAHKEICRNRKETMPRPYEEEPMEADVEYIKSNDPNKCHRPSDSDLTNIYGMSREIRLDFKKLYAQWLPGEKGDCIRKLIDTRTVECNDAIPFDCEEEEEEEEEEDDDDYNGDVMGEGDVKGTSVVMAKTGAGDNLFVYIIQSLLSLSTLASGVVFVKRYIM